MAFQWYDAIIPVTEIQWGILTGGQCPGTLSCNHISETHLKIRVPFQYPIRRLIVRSPEVLKPQDRQFKLSHWYEIWQARQQHCCRGACQISERPYNSEYKSRGLETLRNLTIRRLIGYWNRAQASVDEIYRFLILKWIAMTYLTYSLWSSDCDTIWWLATQIWSTLAQLMACCLMAPSHYLNQCRFIDSKVLSLLWHWHGGNFISDIPANNHLN